MTQDDQPYGSRRRCCEMCGLMLINRSYTFWTKHAHVEDRNFYKEGLVDPNNKHIKYLLCTSDEGRELMKHLSSIKEEDWNKKPELKLIQGGKL